MVVVIVGVRRVGDGQKIVWLCARSYLATSVDDVVFDVVVATKWRPVSFMIMMLSLAQMVANECDDDDVVLGADGWTWHHCWC